MLLLYNGLGGFCFMAFFTTLLQRQVNDVWRRKIQQADAEMRLYKSGKEIRDYLNNKQSLSTAGFVIRRFLQTTNPLLLDSIRESTGCVAADLSNNLNVPWPEPFNQALAKELHRIAKKQGINISATTWLSYLDDAPIKMYKDTPFKVSFALTMGVETTEELLMACGQDTYCFRNPEHFIFYYCQSRPTAFNWKHAQQLLSRYRNELNDVTYNANDASGGMTHILRSDLKRLFQNPIPDAAADEELIQYMLTNQKEFSGLSLTAREDFLRIAKYLSILYPTYSKTIRQKNPETQEMETTTEDVPITILPDGSPKLSELVRALFSTGGWLTTTVGKYSKNGTDKGVRTASSLKRRESSANIEYRRAAINEEADRPFLNSIQYFVDSYSHHLDAIDRVFRRPANPGNVERRDVILFIYFFIRKYPELLADEDMYGAELDSLTSLVFEDHRIDPVMDYLMDELYTIVATQQEAETCGTYDEGANTQDYIELFNEVLRRFGMKEMYMPNPWDRFITMSLFAEDPDFFTEAVLWNTVDEEEELPEKEVEPDIEDTVPLSVKTPVSQPDSPARNELISPTPILVKYPPATPSVILENGKKKFLAATLFRRRTSEYITVNKSCFVVGRKAYSSNDVFQDYGFVTDLTNISRNHAAILFFEGNFYLADISSRAETWINDVHLKNCKVSLSSVDPVYAEYAYKLFPGDQIRFGEEVFIFSI